MSDNDDDSIRKGGGVARKKQKAPVAVGAQKFTQKTKAYQKLKKMFEDKMIDKSDKPSDVRHKDTLFQDFTNQQFRSQFNKLRALYGTCSKEGTLFGWQMLMLL
jgi:hypothetical protein